MDLETPSEGTCLLCRDEEVEYRENKNERPYFQCSRFNAIVNLRPTGEKAETILSQAVEVDPEDAPPAGELEEAADEGDGEPSLGDLLGGAEDE